MDGSRKHKIDEDSKEMGGIGWHSPLILSIGGSSGRTHDNIGWTCNQKSTARYHQARRKEKGPAEASPMREVDCELLFKQPAA